MSDIYWYSAAIKFTRNLIWAIKHIEDKDFINAIILAIETENEDVLDELSDRYIISSFEDDII